MDLLNKGKKTAADRVDESRIKAPEPKETYSDSRRNPLLTSANKHALDAQSQAERRQEHREKMKKRQTTSRLTYDHLNQVNSLINLGYYSSFNDFVGSMLVERLGALSPDEQREFQFMLESLEDQQIGAEMAKKRKNKNK